MVAVTAAIEITVHGCDTCVACGAFLGRQAHPRPCPGPGSA